MQHQAVAGAQGGLRHHGMLVVQQHEVVGLLQQARDNVWPKIFDQAPPIDPQEVLDAIERTLEGGHFWVFPGRGTALAWRMRRWLPGLFWRRIHSIEGR